MSENGKSRYVVLCFTGSGGLSIVDTIPARDPAAAIQHVFEEGHLSREPEGGTYVAVPERSWKPVTVSVKQERRVSLAPATTEKPATQEQKP